MDHRVEHLCIRRGTAVIINGVCNPTCTVTPEFLESSAISCNALNTDRYSATANTLNGWKNGLLKLPRPCTCCNLAHPARFAVGVSIYRLIGAGSKFNRRFTSLSASIQVLQVRFSRLPRAPSNPMSLCACSDIIAQKRVALISFPRAMAKWSNTVRLILTLGSAFFVVCVPAIQ